MSGARVIVSHPSKQGNMYRVPAAASRAGFDTTFLTGLYWRRSPWAETALCSLPTGLRERIGAALERRRLADLDPAAVRMVSGPLPELAYRSLGYRVGNAIHDRLVAAWLRRHVAKGTVGIFHGFQEACARGLAAAEERGLFGLLEVTLPPTTARIVTAERRRLGLPPSGATEPSSDMLRELALARYVVVQSRFSVASVMEYGVEPGRIFLMPLGVDAERFRPPAETGADAPSESRPFRALFTGQMTVRKGVHLLLQAWARAARPMDELLFAGYPADPFIQERIAHAPGGGLRRYLGFVPHERLHEVYREADIFVFPSLAEGGVYVIYEALASGLPCIVSENAGSAVRDGIEGFVVPVGDVEALADRIRRLKEDEALRRRMGLAARARGEAMSWLNFYRRGGLMYREILRRAGATGEGVFDLFER